MVLYRRRKARRRRESYYISEKVLISYIQIIYLVEFSTADGKRRNGQKLTKALEKA